jgi:hypothetical protein
MSIYYVLDPVLSKWIISIFFSTTPLWHNMYYLNFIGQETKAQRVIPSNSGFNLGSCSDHVLYKLNFIKAC